MSGGEGKSDKRCFGAFWDGVVREDICTQSQLSQKNISGKDCTENMCSVARMDDSSVYHLFDSSQSGTFSNYTYVHCIFAIIPIVYCMRQKTAEFRGKESDIAIYEGKDGLQNTWATFIGIVEEPYLEGFVRFWEKQEVQITVSECIKPRNK